MTNLQKLLTAGFPDYPFEFDKPMAPLTYMKVGGPAEAYAALSDAEEIAALKRFCDEKDTRFTIIGGASNVIISDAGVAGVLVKVDIDEVEDTGESVHDKHFVIAGAGIKTALLVAKTVALGYTGLEYFLGVPGTLGGAVYNNSHYLMDLIGRHISRVQIIDEDYQIKWLDASECEFNYDYSRFHETDEVILRAEFALEKGDAEVSRELIAKATKYRAETQPLGPPSSGCIFQNVPNNDHLRKLFPKFAENTHVPAGFLIDQAGLKGTRQGNVEVSQKHAAWMINLGEAHASDILALIRRVKDTVKEKFDVDLQEEVFFLD